MAVAYLKTSTQTSNTYEAEYIDLTQDTGSQVKLKTRKLTAVSACDEDAFDFGRGDPLPSHKRRYRTPVETTIYDEGLERHAPIFQSLVRSNNRDLLQYLASRHISKGFLHEIDMFLDGHLELAEHCPVFVERYNSKRPLAAYLYFVKGYTRPARYIPGFLPWSDEDIIRTASMTTSVTSLKTDQELVDFFDGYEYRWDILAKIDEEVGRLCTLLRQGVRLRHEQRLLVALALGGNPADAYKHYEYNYQTDWLPHRYLPEHVILSELPKSALPGPYPHKMAQPDEQSEETRSHLPTRARMAKANDAGVDVLEVLIQDFQAACVRAGLRRDKVMRMGKQATRRLSIEQSHPTGKDIVNLVMDLVPATQSRQTTSQLRSHPRNKYGRATHLSTLKTALSILVKQEAALSRAFEQANRRGNSSWNDFLALQAVRDSRMRVERQCLTELVDTRRATGKWSNNKCRDVMWQYGKGQVDVLALLP